MATTFRNIDLHPNNNLPSNLRETIYDVIVIGSGPAGRALAVRNASKHLSTDIIEEELFEGDCPFQACIPSKALLRPGEALEAARQLGGARELIHVSARHDLFVGKWDDQLLIDFTHSRNADIAIVRGKGVLPGEKRVKVSNVAGDEITLEAKHAVVFATGSSPLIPDIPGLKDVMPWTPQEATASDHVQKHLVIIGGGVVGCEMATFYGSFKKQVTIVSSSSAPLPRFEPEAGKRVQETLEERGVSVQVSTDVEAFHKKGEGFEAELSNGKTITGMIVLVAAGRKPNTTGIGLERFGICDPQKLEANDDLCIRTLGSRR